MDKREIILSPDYWIILSAPAGSGKTYWLSKRFMEIIRREGISPLKILAITFTEKAAGEMKRRILQMAKNEYPEIYEQYEEEFMMLRISTIHSFCNTFLRRFVNEIGISLGFEILSDSDAQIYFDEKVNEFIMEKIFPQEKKYEWILGASAFFKWERFVKVFKSFYDKRPLADKMFYRIRRIENIASLIPVEFERIKEIVERARKFLNELPDYQRLMGNPAEVYKVLKLREKLKRKIRDKNIEKQLFESLFDLFFFHLTFIFSLFFKEVFEYYEKIKSLEAKVDFPDMEFLAYQILNEGKINEIENILEAFDEKTNHILVDEFQDTNFLQWSIIEKLTEEWRSGWGAKFEKGEKASLFIVGDPMQSIYMFRNANVRTFNSAKVRIKSWLKEKAKMESLRENYRSLESIVDFVNSIFLKDGALEYVPFVKRRRNENIGFVEVIVSEDKDIEREVKAIARRIKNLVGEEIVYEKGTEKKRRCEYKDIAILLRRRKNLNVYEKIFKEENIPYCIVGGIGFWNEPEIELLKHFLEFLAEPSYTLGLYLILKSPFFGFKEKEILNFRTGGKNLWEGVDEKIRTELISLKKDMLEKGIVNSFIDYLIEKQFFKYLGADIQKVKNVLKFLKIIHYLERRGKSLFEIALELRRLENIEREPRANVFSEGMNAVRILTIHRSKGLEFPIVFVPELDSIKIRKSDILVFEEDEKGYLFKIYPSEKGNIDFRFYEDYVRKLKEEEKRILYVALTRARDGLIVSGKFDFKKVPSPEKDAFQYLLNNIGIIKKGKEYEVKGKFKNLKVINVDEIREKEFLYKEEKVKRERIDFKRKIFLPEKIFYSSFDEYYSIIFGEIMHRILDAVSKGLVKEDRILHFAGNLMDEKGVEQKIQKIFIQEIEDQLKILKQRNIWEKIILPRENAFSEFEFIYKENGVVNKGRIDRLILKEDVAEIYDYKISLKKPDREREGKIIKESISQFNKYRMAVKEYFRVKDVKTFIIFTKNGKMLSL